MIISWKEGYEVRAATEGNTAVIGTNREGLLSLSDQLKALADELHGSHIHYDEYNS